MTSVNESNVDQFKTEHECDEHWELRRKFLLAHHDKFSIDELKCMAQVFTNVEFLGCRYPKETMRIINELAKDVVGDYREKQKTRLRRTFVGASDAASSKAKGRSSTGSANSSIAGSPNTSFVKSGASSANSSFANSSSANSSFANTSSANSSFSSPAKSPLYGNFKRKEDLTNQDRYQEAKKKKPMSLRLARAANIVLFEYLNDNAQTIISRAASSYDLNIDWDFEMGDTECLCTIYFNRNKLASATGENQKAAKKEASEIALVEMQKHYYTIKVTKNLTPNVGDLGLQQGDAKADSDAIGNDNIGSKMMKLMGWSGGGLGKSGQGIAEPVSVHQQMTREGLGLKAGMYNMQVFKRKCSEVLQGFMGGDTSTDMVFDPMFTNEERAIIHQEAKRLGLKSQSYGPKSQRILTISRKIHPQELVNELLDLGGSTEKYQLIEPTG